MSGATGSGSSEEPAALDGVALRLDRRRRRQAGGVAQQAISVRHAASRAARCVSGSRQVSMSWRSCSACFGDRANLLVSCERSDAVEVRRVRRLRQRRRSTGARREIHELLQEPADRGAFLARRVRHLGRGEQPREQRAAPACVGGSSSLKNVALPIWVGGSSLGPSTDGRPRSARMLPLASRARSAPLIASFGQPNGGVAEIALKVAALGARAGAAGEHLLADGVRRHLALPADERRARRVRRRAPW